MKEKVFERYSFGSEAMAVFDFAAKLAEENDAPGVGCAEVFAACAILCPGIMHDLLGRRLGKLPDRFKLEPGAAPLDIKPADLTEWGRSELDFSADLVLLFLEDHQGSPFRMINDYVPGRPVGVAEIAFAIMTSPTSEIGDILLANGFPNDAELLENLLKENYIARIREFSTESPREQLSAAAARAGQFEEFMTGALCGQEKAIAELAALFTDFWHHGNHGRPLAVLLLSKAGGGRSFFAETMQRAFVELGLQAKVDPPLDLCGFVHDSSCEVDLLGDSRSFRNARSGKLYDMASVNRRGMMVFEDILGGSRHAKNVLRSFAANHAYDKFHEEVMLLPFNILVFTMKVTDDQYRFLMEKSKKGIDAALMNRVFLAEKEDELSPPDLAAAETACLWQCADRIVLLEQLPDDKLEQLAANRLDAIEKRLDADYGIEFRCGDRDRFIRLLLQSAPHELCPGELADLIDDMFGGLWRTVNRHPELKALELDCAELPEYLHDPARRLIRGDYLAFDRDERIDGSVLRIAFGNIRYTQQERIDCGDYRIEHPKGITFGDIVGLDSVRDELLDSLRYITGREDSSGKLPEPCLGFLLYGPPGTGKTSIAVALANQADIPVFFAASSIFTNAKKLGAMFRKARDMAPAIVVLDEFNSIGDSSIAYKRDAINELLAILDGVQEKSKLLILASTNHPEQIEEAFLRSGRFGRQIKIGLPTAESRSAYIRNFEKEFGFTLSDDVRQDFVDNTDRISLADLKGILGYALRCSIINRQPLDSRILTSALLKFKKNDRRREIGFDGGTER